MSMKDQRRNEWIVSIADYKASELTMSAWCSANKHSDVTGSFSSVVECSSSWYS